VLVDGGVLAGEPDAGAQRRRVGHHVEAGDAGAAGVGFEQGRQDADGRGLARAVGAEHAEHGAGGDRQLHAVERPRRPEGLHEPTHEDGRRFAGFGVWHEWTVRSD
jgi:hypothetical protein